MLCLPTCHYRWIMCSMFLSQIILVQCVPISNNPSPCALDSTLSYSGASSEILPFLTCIIIFSSLLNHAYQHTNMLLFYHLNKTKWTQKQNFSSPASHWPYTVPSVAKFKMCPHLFTLALLILFKTHSKQAFVTLLHWECSCQGQRMASTLLNSMVNS